MKRKCRRCKIGLALGAGAARGLAHLGVLVAMEKAEIPIDVLVGTSFGAFVGANYVFSLDAREVRDRIVGFSRSRQFRKGKFDFIREAARSEPGFLNTLSSLVRKGIMYSSTLTREGFISSDAMQHNLACCIPDKRIEEAAIPFGAVAADVQSGNEVVFTRGPARQAVHASCAIAGVFPPVRVGEMLLVDGACMDKVPVLPAYKMGADFVIGVDVSGDDGEELPQTGAELLLRTSQIEGQALKRIQLHFADVVIQPEVGRVHWADFRNAADLVAEGVRALNAALPEIRRKIDARTGRNGCTLSAKRKNAEPFMGEDSFRLVEMQGGASGVAEPARSSHSSPERRAEKLQDFPIPS